eukprot:CAMPEP_0206432162 /NCGR_PEP_ID=MMETSP0324_2-20121206/7761_1 /ASSEMBLY_ACC=CAM_ASM_000836 /TAXON_ID=2866 /ORGANISM="Crypthecodinium cohnii, Strain Seligo" /LENGTH=208 /DNA_ID=CAMNT_0053898159 /DNA_START=20 /DNA_END=646 /DNA_ORIENTATION=-
MAAESSLYVVVASKSRPKVQAARIGFERMLGKSIKLAVQGVEVDSSVAAQPFGEETRKGAFQRLAAARETGAGNEADFVVAYEGGVEKDHNGRLVCFAEICIQGKEDAYISSVRSATHSLPPGIEKLINEGVELGHATDQFFEEKLAAGFGKGTGGTIGALTGEVVDRVEYYAHPTTLALVPFANAEHYGISCSKTSCFAQNMAATEA